MKHINKQIMKYDILTAIPGYIDHMSKAEIENVFYACASYYLDFGNKNAGRIVVRISRWARKSDGKQIKRDNLLEILSKAGYTG